MKARRTAEECRRCELRWHFRSLSDACAATLFAAARETRSTSLRPSRARSAATCGELQRLLLRSLDGRQNATQPTPPQTSLSMLCRLTLRASYALSSSSAFWRPLQSGESTAPADSPPRLTCSCAGLVSRAQSSCACATCSSCAMTCAHDAAVTVADSTTVLCRRPATSRVAPGRFAAQLQRAAVQRKRVPRRGHLPSTPVTARGGALCRA